MESELNDHYLLFCCFSLLAVVSLDLTIWSLVANIRAQVWRVVQMPPEVPRGEKTLPVACLPAQRRREAAILAARAFVDSPAYTYILRRDANFRLEALVWYALTDAPK